MLNTFIRAVRREFSRHEFTIIFGAQHAQLAATLCLRSGMHTPDGIRNLSLATKDHNPHVAGEVIDEQQEVASSSECSQCHRTTQVPCTSSSCSLARKLDYWGKGSRICFVNTQTSQNCFTWSKLGRSRTIPLALSRFRVLK
jgi:hypothetical protein